MLTVLGLILGNFIWQVVNERDWRRAIELSWFQAVAVGLYAWTH